MHKVALVDEPVAAEAILPRLVVPRPGAARGGDEPPGLAVLHAVDPDLQLRSVRALRLDAQGPPVDAALHEAPRAPDGYDPALVLEVVDLRHDLPAVARDLELIRVLLRRLPEERRLARHPRALGAHLQDAWQDVAGALLEIVELGHHGDELRQLVFRACQELLRILLLGPHLRHLLLLLLQRGVHFGEELRDGGPCQERVLVHCRDVRGRPTAQRHGRAQHVRGRAAGGAAQGGHRGRHRGRQQRAGLAAVAAVAVPHGVDLGALRRLLAHHLR
mmetsp:Transcript_63009/g.184793  ORF Transcript_63009/g.184793 Transcript_63009/m.184793 type:complete len:275 (+) Transcript_63009:298-1122(+)